MSPSSTSTTSDIAAIQSAFNADFDGARQDAGAGADLVWSPTTSQSDLLQLINGAHQSLLVENEEMDSTDITDALIGGRAPRRQCRDLHDQLVGVVVGVSRVDFGWSTPAGCTPPTRRSTSTPRCWCATRAPVPQVAFVGSQNFSTESLRYNRELGVTLRSASLIGQLGTMIRGDYNGAAPWT